MVISLTGLQIYNFRYLNEEDGFHPNNVRTIYTFTGSYEEQMFYIIQSYTDILAAPILRSISENILIDNICE